MNKLIERILILKPVLGKISNGQLLTGLLEWFLRIAAAATALFTLWASWKLWSNISGRSSFDIFISALIIQIFIIIVGFVVVNILLIRSLDLGRLPPSRNYFITPIVCIFIRMLGEIYFTIIFAFSLAIGLATFLGTAQAAYLLPMPMPSLGGATSGLTMIAFGSIYAFGALCGSYFLAEMSGALVDIARNTSKNARN